MTNALNPLQATLKSARFLVGSIFLWLLAAFLYLFLSSQQKIYLQAEADVRNATVIAIATSYVAPLLQTRNLTNLNVFLKTLVARPDIYSGQILDGTGNVLTEFGTGRTIGITLNEAIQFDGQLIGYIRLVVQPISDVRYWALTTFLITLLMQVFWALFNLQRNTSLLAKWRGLNRHLQPLFDVEHQSPQDWDKELSHSGRQLLTATRLLKQRIEDEQLPLLATDPQLEKPQFHTAIVLYCAPTTEALQPKSNSAERQWDTVHLLEGWINSVTELYQGHRIGNGLYIAFGLNGDDAEEPAVNALCAARVLYFLSRNDDVPLSLSIAAGSFWTGNGASPWPLTHAFGLVFDDLDYVHLHHDGELILLTESLFQYAVLNERLQASIYRDVITADGRRLEVWQLDGLQGQYDVLLKAQAEHLKSLDLSKAPIE